jgi:predicted Rossmann fold nucleotide-binding protein DprA/Smf involved in DNA uptake
MDIREFLSDDGQAALALCSGFGLPADAAARGFEPLKLSEWNQLEKQIHASALKRPAALQGCGAEDLAKALPVLPAEAERIERLLGRSGQLAMELESLFSKGMWAITRLDALYPARLRERLKHQAPSVLFGSGDLALLNRGSVAVIGSRNIDESGAAFARKVGHKAAAAKVAVVSGGARGSDRLAMEGALEGGGVTIGVLADSLERTICQPELRQLILDAQLLFLTPYVPTAGFSVGGAMGRNKLIYALADAAVVVSSDYQTGGTWAGATEALKAGWCPVFVRDGTDLPKGNHALLKLGATAFPKQELEQLADLSEWLRGHAGKRAMEQDLFG